MVYEAIIKAIRDYFVLFANANGVLDETIHRENQVINRSVDDDMDFGDFNNEIIEPLELGDINNITIPTDRASTATIQSASILEESVTNSPATNINPSTSTASESTQNANVSCSFTNNQQMIEHSTPNREYPLIRENPSNVTYTVQVEDSIRLRPTRFESTNC